MAFSAMAHAPLEIEILLLVLLPDQIPDMSGGDDRPRQIPADAGAGRCHSASRIRYDGGIGFCFSCPDPDPDPDL